MFFYFRKLSREGYSKWPVAILNANLSHTSEHEVKGRTNTVLAHVIDMFLLSLRKILFIKARIWPLYTTFPQLLVILLMIRQQKRVLCH